MTAHNLAPALSSVGGPRPGPPALEIRGLAKRYRGTWALRDCTFSVPAGRVVALVGPNGAGKTTLLNSVVGLLKPTEGDVRIFGERAGNHPAALQRVAFLAQDKPVYKDFRVSEMLRLGSRLNPRWDDERARARLAELTIPLNRKVGKLSGGQQTQIALTLALAKRPELLVLDEPLADLDPLARHDVTGSLMAAVAETGMTVLLSSHVVPDLVGVCDWLVVLNGGRVSASGDIDEILAGHRMITCTAETADAAALELDIVARHASGKDTTLLVRGAGETAQARWGARPVGLEDVVITYLRDPGAASRLVERHSTTSVAD